MWNLTRNNIMVLDSQTKICKGPLLSNSYHTVITNKMSIDPNKKFPDFINRSNPSMVSVNYQAPSKTMDEQNKIIVDSNINKEQTAPKVNNIPTYNTCSKKKKRRRRRRRRKNRKNKPAEAVNNNADMVVELPQIPRLRERQISTTSEDSFVIFFDENEESPDDDDDEVDFKEHVKCFSSDDDDDEEDIVCSEMDSCDSMILVPHKKVRFAVDNALCEVHPMVKWSYAYQAARKGPWEEYARDRERFRMRVCRTEAILKNILTSEHRSKIYQQRFA